jgi:hypothetical protein
MGEEGRGDEGAADRRPFFSPKRLNPKNRIVSVFLDAPSEKCEKIRV